MYIIIIFTYLLFRCCRSQWLRSLRVGLRPLACWDCGFESQQGTCVSVFCECYVSGRGLCDELITVQRSPTDCGSSFLWSRNLVSEEFLAHWGAVAAKTNCLNVVDVLIFVLVCTVIRKVLSFSSASREVSSLCFTMIPSAEYSISQGEVRLLI